MGTIGERMREIPAASVERSLPMAISPAFERPFAQWMELGEWSPLGDPRRLAFVSRADLQSLPVGRGEFNPVHGGIGVGGAEVKILRVPCPENRASMSPLGTSLHETLARSQG